MSLTNGERELEIARQRDFWIDLEYRLGKMTTTSKKIEFVEKQLFTVATKNAQYQRQYEIEPTKENSELYFSQFEILVKLNQRHEELLFILEDEGYEKTEREPDGPDRAVVESLTIFRTEIQVNLSLLQQFLIENIFESYTDADDIIGAFSTPFKQPKGRLTLKVKNNVFAHLLVELQAAGLLIQKELYPTIEKWKCLLSKRGTELKQNNLSKAAGALSRKNELRDESIANDIAWLIKNIHKIP